MPFLNGQRNVRFPPFPAATDPLRTLAPPRMMIFMATIWRAIRRLWDAEPFNGFPKDAISERLLDQRLRNRLMEQVLGHADWQDSVKRTDVYEHFESYFDFFPYEGEPYPNGALTEDERAALTSVHALVKEAYDWLPHIKRHQATWDEYIATGWPQRIEPVADGALELMLKRGRFSEEQEEETPSGADGWPWGERFKLH